MPATLGGRDINPTPVAPMGRSYAIPGRGYAGRPLPSVQIVRSGPTLPGWTA